MWQRHVVILIEKKKTNKQKSVSIPHEILMNL